MGILTPAPLVLGACSLTAAVELVCAVHLAICVSILANVNSEHSSVVSGVEISPIFQCATGAWCLLGIPLIIHGGIGSIYYVDTHLSKYLYYLCGTLVWAIVWTIIIARYGNACSTEQPSGSGSQASYVCGVSNGMAIFWMAMLISAIGAAMYLVWSMKEYCKRRLETELIRYQEPWQVVASLADEAAGEQAKAMAAAAAGQGRIGGMYPGYGGTAPPGYGGMPPGYGGAPPGYGGAPPGYRAAPQGYAGMPPAGYSGGPRPTPAFGGPGPYGGVAGPFGSPSVPL